MGRPLEKTDRWTDRDLAREIARAYPNRRQFAVLVGLPYRVVTEVLDMRPCRPQDKQAVLAAWGEFSPEALRARAEALAAVPTVGKALGQVVAVERLLAALGQPGS